ncbi:SGNH/GDSL hydrolase family protein [Streptomyces tuirus]|uniref:SGNH/GDSL hydrolase family protein n=1 Tax=Streptomyces tuirus TaxID=68278 RepID=A0A941FC74_9ACTN|nr:SGNH/GDSL hydrolase family protein [Streptomyces tuirus]
MRPVTTVPLRRTLAFSLALAAAVLATVWPGDAADRATADASKAGTTWLGTWATAPTVPFSTGISATGFSDQTIRQNIHTSVGGSRFKLRLSNVYGKQPLTVDAVELATPQGIGGVVPGSSTPVTFQGSRSVTIPVGETATSDVTGRSVAADTDLTVSLYVSGTTGPTTWHRLATATTYVSASGDHTSDTSGDAFTTTQSSFFFVSGLDVAAPAGRGSVVAFGDSLTDGVGSTPDANRRYPDVLARRLGGEVGVLNEGIGANQVVNDTEYGSIGALGRFDQDVLAQPGVRDVIFEEGVNDILGAHYFPDDAPTAEEVIAAYKDLIARAHRHGLRMLGMTLNPIGGAEEYSEAGEAMRQTLNAWIRDESTFDGIIDADALWRDPANPLHLAPDYDSGDGLHPNDAGYAALANSIDLDCLTPNSETPVLSGAREDCTL